MAIRQYVVDAFTETLFRGNPAAVCVMDQWLPDGLMQSVAVENSFSETAFAVKEGGKYHLRWFTPGGEIDLCGHATLATGFVIHTFIEPGIPSITFSTLSGDLTVACQAGRFEMCFPSYPLEQIAVTPEITAALGVEPEEAYLARDLMCVFKDSDTVRTLKPDMALVGQLEGLLVHATAPDAQYDCVSRSFAPKLAVDEDPVCGSGHCHIFPYWSRRLRKNTLTGWQASRRGGTLYGRCDHENGYVYLSGKAVLFSIADLQIGSESA